MQRVIIAGTCPANTNADNVGNSRRVLYVGIPNCNGEGIDDGLICINQVAGIILAEPAVGPSGCAWAEKQMEIVIHRDFAGITLGSGRFFLFLVSRTLCRSGSRSSEFRVQGSKFRVQVLFPFLVLLLAFRTTCHSGSRSSEFRVQGSRFRVQVRVLLILFLFLILVFRTLCRSRSRGSKFRVQSSMFSGLFLFLSLGAFRLSATNPKSKTQNRESRRALPPMRNPAPRTFAERCKADATLRQLWH